VLQQLVEDTPLQQLHYQIIHYDSPDKRGIDVALLYQPSKFSPISQEAIRINFPHRPYKTTRDVLYAKGILWQTDTVHIFINHWPSRRGGQQASEPDRNYVADLVREKTDSLLAANAHANIIIMGDFNDGPEDASLLLHLGAKRGVEPYETAQLYNMMQAEITAQGIAGTHKYQGQWHVFDQIIVSGALLQGTQALHIPGQGAAVFGADFLLQEDITYMGKKPFRTYTGYHYQGGFSDHLPVYIDLVTTGPQLTQKEK
jgi:endonuclease/exonuclease/phosphatase family metal-dependent hydrolase